jgi:hypothetical protein
MAQQPADSQKLDYLWKKIGFAATKTDIAANVDPTSEGIASPLQIRGDKIMRQSGTIPAVMPGANTAIVGVYLTSLPVETAKNTDQSVPTQTWKTGLTDWISPEFGSTYQVKVYIAPSGAAGTAGVSTSQVFATGSGNNDQWFFDYQSGVLNFNGQNPPQYSFTGNSVYISGARYIGEFGVTSSGGGVGNYLFSNLTISANSSAVSPYANLVISTLGQGALQFTGNSVGIPAGNTLQRPTVAGVGYTRWNTTTENLEVWDGTEWDGVGAGTVTSQTFTGNGVQVAFTLNNPATTVDVLVAINGTMQIPTTAYAVSGTTLTMGEAPAPGDIVEVRQIAGTPEAVSIFQKGTSKIELPRNNGPIEFTTDNKKVQSITTFGATVGEYPAVVIPSAASTTTIDSFSATTYRSAKYILQANTAAGTYEANEVLVLHNGSTALVSTYANVRSAASLGNVTASISSGNVQVAYTNINNNTNVRLVKTLILI